MRKRIAGVGFRIAVLIALLLVLPVAAGHATPAATGTASSRSAEVNRIAILSDFPWDNPAKREFLV